MTLAWGLFHIISQQSGGVRQCRPQPRLRLSVCSWLIWEWENLPRAKHPQPPHHLSTLLQQRGSFQTRAAGGKHLWISKTLHSVFQTSNHTHYTHTNHDWASAWRRMCWSAILILKTCLHLCCSVFILWCFGMLCPVMTCQSNGVGGCCGVSLPGWSEERSPGSTSRHKFCTMEKILSHFVGCFQTTFVSIDKTELWKKNWSWRF